MALPVNAADKRPFSQEALPAACQEADGHYRHENDALDWSAPARDRLRRLRELLAWVCLEPPLNVTIIGTPHARYAHRNRGAGLRLQAGNDRYGEADGTT